MSKVRVSRFSPAIQLLSRFTFPQKFALISCFFAPPLFLALFFLYDNLQQQIRMSRLEVDGVDYLTPFNALHDQIPQAMSLANACLKKQSFAVEHYPTHQSEIDSLFARLAEADSKLGARLHTTQHFRILQSSWEDLKTQLPKLRPEISDDQFGQNLSALAEEHYCEALGFYAAKLTDHASNFDIADMESTLQEFDSLVTGLNHTATTTS